MELRDMPYIKLHELPTVLVALSWWAGRVGRVPLHLQHYFDTHPPLNKEEIEGLIVRLETDKEPEPSTNERTK